MEQLEQAGVPVKVELDRALAGHAARIIVEAARAYQAGVIVMGSNSRGDLTSLLLGSEAHKVIHLADRPGRPLTHRVGEIGPTQTQCSSGLGRPTGAGRAPLSRDSQQQTSGAARMPWEWWSAWR